MTDENKKLDDQQLEEVAGGFWIAPDLEAAAALVKQTQQPSTKK